MWVVKGIKDGYLTDPLASYWKMCCDVCIWFFQTKGARKCVCPWLVKMQFNELWKMPPKESWHFWSIIKDAAFCVRCCWQLTWLGKLYKKDSVFACSLTLIYVLRFTGWFTWGETPGGLWSRAPDYPHQPQLKSGLISELDLVVQGLVQSDFE